MLGEVVVEPIGLCLHDATDASAPLYAAMRGLVHIGVALDRTNASGAMASARHRAVRLAAWCAANVSELFRRNFTARTCWFMSGDFPSALPYPVNYSQAVNAGDWRTLEWVGLVAHSRDLSLCVAHCAPQRLMHAPAGYVPSTNKRARDRARASRTVLQVMLRSPHGCSALAALLDMLPATPMRAEWLEALRLGCQQRGWRAARLQTEVDWLAGLHDAWGSRALANAHLYSVSSLPFRFYHRPVR